MSRNGWIKWSAVTAMLGLLVACGDDPGGGGGGDPKSDVPAFLGQVMAKLAPGGVSGPWVAHLTARPLTKDQQVATALGDGQYTATGDYWFAYVDQAATGMYGHPTAFVYRDAASGQVTVEDHNWWPVIDGKPLAEAGVPLISVFAPREPEPGAPAAPPAGGGSGAGPKSALWVIEPDHQAKSVTARVLFDGASSSGNSVVNVAADLDGDGALQADEWLLKNATAGPAQSGWIATEAFAMPLDSQQQLPRQFWFRVALSAQPLPESPAWTGDCSSAGCSDQFVTLEPYYAPAAGVGLTPPTLSPPKPNIPAAPCKLTCEPDKIDLSPSCKALVINLGDNPGETMMANEMKHAVAFFEARVGQENVTQLDLPTVAQAVQGIKDFMKGVRCLDEAHIYLIAHGIPPANAKQIGAFVGQEGASAGVFVAHNKGLETPLNKERAEALFLSDKALHDAITSAPHCPHMMNYYEAGQCRNPGYCNLNLTLLSCFSGSLIQGDNSLALPGANVLTAASDSRPGAGHQKRGVMMGEAFRAAFTDNKADATDQGGNGDGVTSNEEAMNWATEHFEGKGGTAGPVKDAHGRIASAWDSDPQNENQADCDCTCKTPTTTCLVTDQQMAAIKATALLFDVDISDCAYLTIDDVLHSAAAIGAKLLAGDFTSIRSFFAFMKMLSQLKVDAVYNNSDLPCGAGPNGYTLCPSSPQPFPAGDTHLIAAVVAKPVPLSDPTNHFQYAFVFDADGDPSNNYQASPQYPNDFFDGTDRWYEALYTPSSGWTLKVTQMSGGAPQPVSSNARITIKDNALLLAVPASEFKVPKPSFRITVFRHTGDYGINPPHDWDGSLWPAVADGLQSYP